MAERNSRSSEFRCNVAAEELRLVDLRYHIDFLSACVTYETNGMASARWPGRCRAPPPSSPPGLGAAAAQLAASGSDVQVVPISGGQIAEGHMNVG
jgi:hypothetical protein